MTAIGGVPCELGACSVDCDDAAGNTADPMMAAVAVALVTARSSSTTSMGQAAFRGVLRRDHVKLDQHLVGNHVGHFPLAFADV